MLFMNHSGVCSERSRINGPVHSLLMRGDMELMAVLTHEMGLSQYSVTYDGQTSQTMNVGAHVCVCVGSYSLYPLPRYIHVCLIKINVHVCMDVIIISLSFT